VNLLVLPLFLPNEAFLCCIQRGDLQVHVYRCRQWNRFPPTGRLEALQLVKGFVEAPLYRGLIAGELGEGVCSIGTPDKGEA